MFADIASGIGEGLEFSVDSVGNGESCFVAYLLQVILRGGFGGVFLSVLAHIAITAKAASLVGDSGRAALFALESRIRHYVTSFLILRNILQSGLEVK